MPHDYFGVFDLKDFYLITPTACYTYLCLPISIIPDKHIDEYELCKIVSTDGWIYT